MAFRVEVLVIDDGVFEVASDRPEVVKTWTVSERAYQKRALAEKLAHRVAEWGITNERSITGKAATKKIVNK